MRDYILLGIKGTPMQAQAAAFGRGLPVQIGKYREVYNETYARTAWYPGCEAESIVLNWHREDWYPEWDTTAPPIKPGGLNYYAFVIPHYMEEAEFPEEPLPTLGDPRDIPVYCGTPSLPRPRDLSALEHKMLMDVLDQGRIQGIKMYREMTGSSLKEALAFVNKIMPVVTTVCTAPE